jgi:hypothetical protein
MLTPHGVALTATLMSFYQAQAQQNSPSGKHRDSTSKLDPLILHCFDQSDQFEFKVSCRGPCSVISFGDLPIMNAIMFET